MNNMGDYNRVTNAVIEIKVSVFCAVIAGLSIVYKIIEPELGDVFFKIALVTFCLSLSFAIYKMIFGNLGGPFVVMFFLFMYIAAVGHTLGIGEMVKWGVSLGLIVIAIKAFIIIFVSKTRKSNSLKCKKCGQIMASDSDYCENCGSKLE